MKKQTAKIWLTAAVLMMSSLARGLTLDEYLSQVQQKNKNLLSLDASTEAADVRYEQGNLDLSPVFNAGANYLDDKAQQFSAAGTLTRNEVRQYSLGLSKKFSTGTKASVQGLVQSNRIEATSPATGPLAFETHTGTMAFSLSQSLWKDFFGRSTRLRWERESTQKLYEKTGYNLQAKQTLIKAESAFWDLLYLQQELTIRKGSLERARRIESWVRRRAGNGIGDRADVLNAQGLVASRELQLIGTQDELKAAEKNFADQLELPADQPVPQLQANLEQVRPLNQFVGGERGQVVRLDSYLSLLDAQVKKVNAQEAVETVRPDLVLSGQYKTNGYSDTDSGAVSHMNDRDYPTTSVGLNFTWLLDWDAKNSVRDSARQDALAAQLKKERQLLESQTAWNEINRRHEELSARIKAASILSQIQTSKAAAERDKLSKGRSITSNVITAEQEAAEAELNLTKLKAEQRKLESQGRLFVKIQEGT